MNVWQIKRLLSMAVHIKCQINRLRQVKSKFIKNAMKEAVESVYLAVTGNTKDKKQV